MATNPPRPPDPPIIAEPRKRVWISRVARVCNADGVPVLTFEKTENGILVNPLPGLTMTEVTDADLREALDGLR